MKKVKIAFCGKMGSGKTFLSSTLMGMGVENAKLFTRVSFADGPYDIARRYFGMTTKNRNLLQNIGEMLKTIKKDVWVDHTISKIRDCEYNSIVLDDCRFPNEFYALKKDGFIMIKINIDPETQMKRLKNTYKNNWKRHYDRKNNESETALDRFDDNMFDLILDADEDIRDKMNKIHTVIKSQQT